MSHATRAFLFLKSPENLLIGVAAFSVASLFAIEVNEIPILKSLATICLVLAAFSLARMRGVSLLACAAGVPSAVILALGGTFLHWDYFKQGDLWLIKPLLFIVIMVMTVPFLAAFDFLNSKFQKGLSYLIILLMVTLFAQAVILLMTKEVFDFQAALGLGQTRSHHRIYSIDVFRLSGIAIEPAIFCSMMFCLLMICTPRMHLAIRVPAEVSMGLCLSALGWIMLGVLFYRNFLLMPRRSWMKSVGICLFALISSLLIIYPADASKFTMLRIICPQTDPSASARLLAFMPQSPLEIDLGICPSTDNVPDEEDILREALTGHQRGSNLSFVNSAFGISGLIVFSALILSLIVATRRFHSAPIFVFASLMSFLTEPIFWLGFLGCALLLRQLVPERGLAKEALT